MWTWRDFFCGGGTAALAAQDVGFRVELGVDCDAVALKAFRRNIAGGRVVCERLGDKDLVWESGAEPTSMTHCHFSPPCQEVSNAKGGSKDPIGVKILQWSIRNAVASCGSWSVETVVGRSVSLDAKREDRQKKCNGRRRGVLPSTRLGGESTFDTRLCS